MMYRTVGIMNTNARLSNYGKKSEVYWSGNQQDAAADRRYLKELGYDSTTFTIECPNTKKGWLDLLNKVTNQ